ncbi:MAG: hypothetical protein IPP66_13650 [Anaerolineales bacterium]|nr:hypothetical protein [Anaerolineales bacterium]
MNNNPTSQNYEEARIIIDCENCHRKLRIPRRNQKLHIVCPTCRYEFDYQYSEIDSTRPLPQPHVNYEGTKDGVLADTGWKCKNCGNFNVRTLLCLKCGKEKSFVPNRNSSTPPIDSTQSKSDQYYEKGWQCFIDSMSESDKNKSSGLLSKSHGYLTMAYAEAGKDIEAQKGIAGLMALVLTHMNDCKNAETWARAELKINPTNIFAKLSWYFIELDKLVQHKGFIAPDVGGGAGSIFTLLTVGVDVGRVQNKKNAVKTAAIEAAKALENKVRTDPEPNPGSWLLWSWILLSIIENMWTNKMKEPYLCNVLLNLPWHRFSEEQIKDLQEPIEEIRIAAHGFLGRLK